MLHLRLPEICLQRNHQIQVTDLTNTLTVKDLVEHEHKSLIYVLLILAVVYFPFAGKAFTIDRKLPQKSGHVITRAFWQDNR